MHRDVKPHNVMIDHENRKVRLWSPEHCCRNTRGMLTHLLAAAYRLGFG
jgi:serine/threonine protein kinase